MRKPIIFCTKDELCQRTIDTAIKKKHYAEMMAVYNKTINRASEEHGLDHYSVRDAFSSNIQTVWISRYVLTALVIGIMIGIIIKIL